MNGQQQQVAININSLASILASEIEASVFEQHVVPALEVARKVAQEQSLRELFGATGTEWANFNLWRAKRNALITEEIDAQMKQGGGIIIGEAMDKAMLRMEEALFTTDPVNQELLAALEPFAKAHETWNGGNAPLHFSTAAVPAHFRRAADVYRAAIAAAEAAQPVVVEQLKLAENNWPEKCPITRREFFMEIDGVPTYGGPFDSYTIPEMTGEASQPFHERELFVRRYDHDRGGWVEDEFISLRVIHEDVLMELEEAAQQVASAQPVAVHNPFPLTQKDAKAATDHLASIAKPPAVAVPDAKVTSAMRLAGATVLLRDRYSGANAMPDREDYVLADSVYRAMLSAAQKGGAA